MSIATHDSTSKQLPQQGATIDLRQVLRDFTTLTDYNDSRLLRWNANFDREDGANIRVALLDSGIHLLNPALKGADLRARDFTHSGGVFDRTGHGTKGAILLVGQNYLRGIAPACTLLVGKVLGTGNSDTSAIALAQGICWAIAEGAQVIILPLGRHQNSPLVKESIHQALAKNCQIFAAAGNFGADICLFPARLFGVIAVSAVDLAGVPLSGCCQNSQVDCYAPGKDIFPSHLAGGSINGSSAATVVAAGVAALQIASAARQLTSEP